MRPVSVLESVSERKAGRLAGLRRRDRPRPRHHLSPPLHRPHPPGRRLGPPGGRRGRGAGVGAVGADPPGPQRPRRGRPRGAGRHRPAGRRLLQPTLAGQAARGWHRGDLLREGRRVPGDAPDGEPGGRRGGRRDPGPADPAHPPGVPGVGEGGADLLGDRGVRRGGAPAGGGVRGPAAPRMAVVARPVGPDRGLRRHPPARVVRRGRAGPAPPGLRRAVPVAARPGAAATGLRGQRPCAAPRRLAARDHRCRDGHARGALPRGPALRADEGPAPGTGGDRGRHGRTVPHAPPPPGRRRLRQDRRRAGGAAGRGPERPPGRAHGADRGAGGAALLGRARAAGRPGGPRRDGRRRGAGRAPDQPGEGQGARRRPGRAGVGRRGAGGGDPCAVDRGGRVRVARCRRDRRAAPLRR